MSGQHLDKLETTNSNDNLTRQITISREEYERLFFQPSPPVGDLAKRLGNPTLLGLCGFLIPFQATMFCLMGFQGTNANSTVAISGAYFFLGGIAMNIAGICEFILGNTYPFAVFIIYGSHWCQLGYALDPVHDLVGVYGAEGATSKLYNSGTGFYNLTMCLISFIFWFGSMRTNGPFCLAIFCLIPLFGLFAAANFHIGYHPTAAGIEYALYLQKIAGGFGFVTALCGWYLAIITSCASTGLPCPLPIFDLSTKVFSHSKAARDERAGAGGGAVDHSKHS
ncbi:hypothetical protein MBLNU459_g2965t1 [Dothideomycetes sp. NU459]